MIVAHNGALPSARLTTFALCISLEAVLLSTYQHSVCGLITTGRHRASGEPIATDIQATSTQRGEGTSLAVR